MKRNSTVKKTGGGRKSSPAGDSRANGAKKKPAQRFRKYLDEQFTKKLMAHMHRAKKAALEAQE